MNDSKKNGIEMPIKEFDENEFDDDLFEQFNVERKEEEISGKKKWNGHLIFFAIVGCLFLFAIVRLAIWNRGVDSGYDPNEDTSEFDTEPLDYIQPLNNTQLENKPDDGITTIFCFGNSPFADNGADNALAREIGERYDATVINASFPDSYQSVKLTNFSAEEYPKDGISLYHVTNALVTGDFSMVDAAASHLSDDIKQQAEYLKTVDLSTADMIVIMYDIMDYIDHRPVMDPNNSENLLTVTGSLQASVKLIQEKYPYIRIVVLSTPACGKTVDDYYVDGDIHDLGNGTLSDYLGHSSIAATSCGISFIDTYFGVINVDNRNQYLVDDYHLNEDGCNAIADRIAKLIFLNE